MEAVRSGLCHGPGCERRISERSPSEDFCSERCAARWNGRWDVTAERVWQAQHREDGTLWTVSAGEASFQFTDSSQELFERTYLQWAFQERSEPMPPMLASLKQRGMLRTVEPVAEERAESALTRPWWRCLLGWLR